MKVLFSLLISLSFCLRAFPVQAEEEGKPNILFIAIDDLNNYISPLDNHPGIKTPNFDRLAKRSVTFSNAHCAAPACHPSRVAVMTGVHPVTSGLYRNLFRAHGPRWRHESKVLEDAVVLSQHFRDHGYRAVGGGKIFHTLQWTPGDSQNDPNAWDDYRGDPLDPISKDWPRPKFGKGQNEGFVGRRPLSNHYFGSAPLLEDEDKIGDHLVVDWAIEQMNSKPEKPMFLAVGLFRPHIPFEVPQRWFDLYPIDEVQLPEHRIDDLDDAHVHERRSWHKWVTDNDQWKVLMQGYLASISYVDNQVGRLLDALDESPIKANTIVVLWTDHGFHIGEKENWEKFALWDQTTNVPLFIHAPGVSKDGIKTNEPTTLTDLYPTLCELAGLPVPEQCDGASLVPLLKNPSAKAERTAMTSYQFAGEKAPSHAVADSRYRLIHYPDGFEELYDLQTDPHEFTNRIDDAELTEVRARLAKALPLDPAPNVGVPPDSPYNQGRRAGSAPKIARKLLLINLKVEPKPGAADGVLAAHGGDWHGYSVFVQDGQLKFAVRHDKKLFQITGEGKVPEETFTAHAYLVSDGTMRLLLGSKLIAEGKAAGPIIAEPNEGPTLGMDDLTPVGEYQTPFRYQGRVSRIRSIGEPKDSKE